MRKIRNKRAQEEMVGFVLIMLVVAVIFVIFLGIFLKKGPTTDKADSEEVSQFLDAALKFTVQECPTSASGGKPTKLSILITECYKNPGSACPTGVDCKVVIEDNLRQIIESSWRFSTESPEQGYQILITDPTSANSFITFAEGIVSPRSTRGAEKLLPTQDGAMRISLEITLKPDS